jgi:hypothetical protein
MAEAPAQGDAIDLIRVGRLERFHAHLPCRPNGMF